MKKIRYVIAAWVAMSYPGFAQTLHVYGPGGPLAPMKECAELYRQTHRVDVVVQAGPDKQWIAAAQQDGDVIFGGAEYMLTQFALDHDGFLREGSRTELYDRAVGILVRPGNPKGIRSLRDLATPGVRILDVNGAGQLGLWEDLIGRLHLISEFQSNIALAVPNSAEAIKAWNTRPELDAWVTYELWAKRLPTTTALIQLPSSERLYRGTPIAITTRSTNVQQAIAFIQFLKTPQAHAIFVKWGWQ